jgi:hypothetical protein
MATMQVLSHRYAPVALAVLALLMFLPNLKSGLLLDDFIHWSILADPSEMPKQLWNTGMVYENPGRLSTALFRQFGIGGEKEKIRKCIDYGVFPWWSRDDIRGGFWRPLTSFTHWLDYRLFPHSPALMHTHSVLWFSAVTLLVAVLYRRLMGATWLAGLAALMYLLDENSYFPTIFIANRNALVAIFFGLLCLLAHHRWRTADSLAAAVLAQVCLLLSLLAGEAGIATFAYLFAYAVALEQGNLRRRAASLVPAISIIVLWRLIYNLLGYGLSGVGLYVDPVNDPLRYALAVLKRAPVLLMGQLTLLSPDLLMAASEPLKMWAWLFSIITLALIFVVLTPLLRQSRLARFWLVAMIGSVLPFCATFPSSRNLLFTGIAAFGLIATFLGSLLTERTWAATSSFPRKAAWALCVLLLLTHLPIAALGRTGAPKMTDSFVGTFSSVMDIDLPEDVADRDVVVVNTPAPLFFAHLPFVNAYQGRPLPRTIRTLVPGLRPLTVRRTGPNTLAVRAEGGDIFSCQQNSPLGFVHVFRTFNELFRSDRFAFRPGDRVSLSRLTIEITAVDAKAMPTEVSFTFATSLDDPSLCLYRFDWHTMSYAPFNVPQIGEQIEIAGPSRVSLRGAIKYVIDKQIGAAIH